MSGPRLIEVAAPTKDFAEDALKMSSVMLTAWAVNSFLLNKPEPLMDTMQMLLVFGVGLAVHHLFVDQSLLRFVVQSGQESMYAAMRRYK
jgi:hypothetical protein